jgi:acyl-CoA synthetase (AMP-forming)/AMP-acid ligase II
MNLVDYLLAQADKNAIALIAPEDTYTYGDVCAAAASIGNILRAAGLAKGDRVGILAGNSLFWVASYLGILQMGGVAVPFAKTLEPGRFPQTVAFTGCRALLGQPDYLEKYGHAIASDVLVVSDSPTPLHLSREITQIRFAFESTSCASEPVDEERDLAALMFTSGSTGAPRAVMVSHRNIIANTDSIIAYLRLSAADRMLCVLPFHYCFGTSLLHTHLRVGGSLVLADFWPPTMLFRRLTEMGCTGFAGVPSIFQTLVRNTALSESGFRALRKIQQAGGKLPTPILREMATTLPETEVFVMYGQTEATARLSYLEPDRLSDKLGSIGRAIPGVTLTIVDETGQPMPPGAAGEIAAKGENITRGYWQDPAATAQSFRDGALYTGDIAYADEEGYILSNHGGFVFPARKSKRKSCC